MNDPKVDYSKLDCNQLFKFYEDGKHRRYTLLFAVNGGAGAIAKFSADTRPNEFLGGLSNTTLAYGMVAFTLIMFFDIFTFGKRMRLLAREIEGNPLGGVFTSVGKVVLTTICLLVIAGWLLIAVGLSSRS